MLHDLLLNLGFAVDMLYLFLYGAVFCGNSFSSLLVAGRLLFSFDATKSCSSIFIGGDRDCFSILFWKNLADVVSDFAFSSEFELLLDVIRGLTSC